MGGGGFHPDLWPEWADCGLTSIPGLISFTARTSAEVPRYVTMTLGQQLWFISATLTERNGASDVMTQRWKKVQMAEKVHRLTLETPLIRRERAPRPPLWNRYSAPVSVSVWRESGVGHENFRRRKRTHDSVGKTSQMCTWANRVSRAWWSGKSRCLE